MISRCEDEGEVSKFSSALSLERACCVTAARLIPSYSPQTYPVLLLMLDVSCCCRHRHDKEERREGLVRANVGGLQAAGEVEHSAGKDFCLVEKQGTGGRKSSEVNLCSLCPLFKSRDRLKNE